MSPTIITQTTVTKEKVNLNLDMNTDLFWSYLKHRFNENFANLVCYELNFFVPLSFTSIENLDSLKKYIHRRKGQLNDSSIKIYFEHEDNSEDTVINESYLCVLDAFRQEVIHLFNKKKKSFGTALMSDSTDTSNDNKNDKRKKRKLDNTLHSQDLSIKRRKREIRTSKHNRSEWSFSSDEYVLPTLGELVFGSSNTQYDYTLYTVGRLDNFCSKYLMFENAKDIRTFQYQAQCALQMHQEHLYEYFRFIRNSDHIMSILGNLMKDNITNGNDINKKIHLIINKLVEIKQTFGFTSFGYKTNDE